MLFMTKAQLKYTSFGILTIFIKLIQTTPSDVEAFDLFLPHFTIVDRIFKLYACQQVFQIFQLAKTK